MPKNEPDPVDPMHITGVEVSVEGPEAVCEMAASFAAEMAWLGHDASSLMRIFNDPFYSAAHGALKQLGEHEVKRIVTAVCRDAAWEV